MNDSSQPTATTDEWMQAIAELSTHYGPEPLIAMLGYLTSELTDELRGETIAMARTYVANQRTLRPFPPLTIVDSPLSST